VRPLRRQFPYRVIAPDQMLFRGVEMLRCLLGFPPAGACTSTHFTSSSPPTIIGITIAELSSLIAVLIEAIAPFPLEHVDPTISSHPGVPCYKIRQACANALMCNRV
jgi:hypothetical protein